MKKLEYKPARPNKNFTASSTLKETSKKISNKQSKNGKLR